ncbi:uncharacterized protein LOC100835874 [Brachypodium distachyon]|uniref:Uncharacterized protein n=1 Tax=Brachypodium distachyon TaxID=15368 RepID=I1H1B7_BRADI|nr:uncharacterized protein LOC100835874 [Brachypodium distachyon]KQK19743.1 hypothetical protein BRADI_1g50190v3 [Brachypodium distachyon]|eukprot:XP_003557149.3 uncharacterized protein LOC100835874 [Brachypodium distachyon]
MPADAAASPLAQAEADLAAGRLRSAQKHARRAARLDPDSPAASLLLTATSVLLADDDDPRATLLLLPNASDSSPSSIRRHYKSLSRSLRPSSSCSPAVSAAAKEALRRAAEAYASLKEDTEAAPPQTLPTFWTACAGCRLLHEFDRQYVGFRLTCPSCRRKFLASEVPPPPPPKAEEPEMTLAELQLQLQLGKRKARDHDNHKAKSSTDDDEEEENVKMEVDELDSDDSGQMAVEDSDFYNFDADRGERCFKRGQVWALYGDDDGMPRHYALVETVSPGGGRHFRAQIRWLELQPNGEEGKPCGDFKVGRAVTVHSVNVFSHLVACERVAREAYRVYPRKGSVWAFHADDKDGSDSGRCRYEFVVFLSGYSELYGASFGYLEKVQGFRSIFTRVDIGSHAVQSLQKGDVGVLSHQIPARKVPKGDASELPPGDCWELDPASLPSELLRIELQK